MRLWLKMTILFKFHRQMDFARACGKGDDWLSKIIQGRNSPTKEDRELILSRLGLATEPKHLFLDWSQGAALDSPEEQKEKGD